MSLNNLYNRLENYSLINLKVEEYIDDFSNLAEFKQFIFKLQDNGFWFCASKNKISNYVINQIIMNHWNRG